MKNEHLLPVSIIDLVEKFENKAISEHERVNYQMRVEAVVEYCNDALNKHKPKTVYKEIDKAFKKKN
jgi:hypothetical protein